MKRRAECRSRSRSRTPPVQASARSATLWPKPVRALGTSLAQEHAAIAHRAHSLLRGNFKLCIGETDARCLNGLNLFVSEAMVKAARMAELPQVAKLEPRDLAEIRICNEQPAFEGYELVCLVCGNDEPAIGFSSQAPGGWDRALRIAKICMIHFNEGASWSMVIDLRDELRQLDEVEQQQQQQQTTQAPACLQLVPLVSRQLPLQR